MPELPIILKAAVPQTQAQDVLPNLLCDAPLQALVAAHLHAFDVQGASPDVRADTTLRHAAVCVAIIDAGHGADVAGMPQYTEWSHQAALLLTRRSGKLRNHSGQWALAGGRLDAGETPEQAALREMFEEVNLQLDERAILGRLDDFVSRSGFVITPIVVWAGPVAQISPNPDEVASVHRIPIAELFRPDAPLLAHEPHSEHQVLRMPVGSSWIAAPTAAILFQFREVCIAGRATRVAHFEQPKFAWK